MCGGSGVGMTMYVVVVVASFIGWAINDGSLLLLSLSCPSGMYAVGHAWLLSCPPSGGGGVSVVMHIISIVSSICIVVHV